MYECVYVCMCVEFTEKGQNIICFMLVNLNAGAFMLSFMTRLTVLSWGTCKDPSVPLKGQVLPSWAIGIPLAPVH